MKEILCFGDSNTWGWNPTTKERYAREERWTGVLRKILGDGYHVIEEGLNGRTTVWEDPIEGCKSGKEYLIPCLETHKPLDLVVILLGTNDLKKRFSLSAYDVAKGVGALIEIVQKSEAGRRGKPPRILLMAPPPLGKLSEYAEMFENATEKSKRLSKHYQNIARELGCEFFDTARTWRSSDIDGIHIEKKEHEALGKAVAPIVEKILEDA